jgi:hypothetical protein
MNLTNYRLILKKDKKKKNKCDTALCPVYMTCPCISLYELINKVTQLLTLFFYLVEKTRAQLQQLIKSLFNCNHIHVVYLYNIRIPTTTRSRAYT